MGSIPIWTESVRAKAFDILLGILIFLKALDRGRVKRIIPNTAEIVYKKPTSKRKNGAKSSIKEAAKERELRLSERLPNKNT